MFNIFTNDLFYFINTCSLFNYADDNTITTANNNPDVVIDSLVLDSNVAITWFKNKYMQANPDKFQLLLLKPDCSDDKFPKEVFMYITDVAIPRCCNVKLLGVNIDERLTFDEHIRPYV